MYFEKSLLDSVIETGLRIEKEEEFKLKLCNGTDGEFRMVKEERTIFMSPLSYNSYKNTRKYFLFSAFIKIKTDDRGIPLFRRF